MEAKILNPFLEAIVSLLKEVTGTDAKRGELSLEKEIVKIKGMAAIIGITGDLSGRVLIDMSIPTALKIASVMNMEEFSKVDDMVRATIQELANMIAGRSVTKLNDMGFKLDITPPTICEGTDTTISNKNLEIIAVPFETDFGELVVDLGVVESGKVNPVFMDSV